MSTLLLRLAAPIQSWGIDSRFETRRTEREPTKSGVVGMLASALGIPRDGNLDRLNSLRFGVRVDKPGELLCDFHTALPENMDRSKSYITNRYYLSDAIFLAGLESEDKDFMRELEEALKSPVFPLFLGRRSCPPTQPLVLGIRNLSLEDALRQEPWLVTNCREHGSKCLRIIIDCGYGEKGAVRRRDLPVSFSPYKRRYGYRTAKEEFIYKQELAEHDAMVEL